MKRAIVAVAAAAVLALPCAAFALTPQELLGKKVYNDQNLSMNGNQACVSCHIAGAGFADRDNRIVRFESPVSDGSDTTLFGGRNAPTAAYEGFSPVFSFNAVDGLYIGGAFWDGRATGQRLNDPLAEQAQGPFFNPVEMALTQLPGDPKGKEVVDRVLASGYKNNFKSVCGNAPVTPVQYETAFDCIALAVAAFERTPFFNRFSSLFDSFRVEQGGDVSGFGVDVNGNFAGVPAGFTSAVYTAQQAKGLALFNAADKGNCAACHPTGNFDATTPPVFTDFSFDNLGLPFNPRIAAISGVPQPIDYGLGAVTTILTSSEAAVMMPKYRGGGAEQVPVVASEAGKHKVSTLRNVAKTPPYGHNGIFGTLYEVVHFYNTRDVGGTWAAPEYSATVNNAELGNLGLSFDEEMAIVAFMNTLSDL